MEMETPREVAMIQKLLYLSLVLVIVRRDGYAEQLESSGLRVIEESKAYGIAYRTDQLLHRSSDLALQIDGVADALGGNAEQFIQLELVRQFQDFAQVG
jgi:hypothetical protein